MIDTATAADIPLSATRRGIPRRFTRDVLVPFAVTRVGLMAFAWLGFHILPAPFKSERWEVGSNHMMSPIAEQLSADTHPFVNMWSRWDSEWYLSIAKNGYQFRPGEESNVAFFPFYPLLVRGIHAIIPLRSDAGWFLIGILLSNAALLLALTYLYRLVLLDYDRAIASRTILYLCVFPTSLFLSAFYTEAVFLAAIVTAFYCGRSGRWLLAGCLAAAAALCRPPGGLVILPLAFEYLSQRQFRLSRIRADFLALGLAPLAVFGHLAFLRWRFGAWDILSQAESQSWARSFTLPWNTLIDFFHHARHGPESHDSWWDLGCTIGLLFLAFATCFRLRRSYALYAVVSVLFVTSWAYLTSMLRFGAVIFPIFILLALWGEKKAFHRAYLGISGTVAVIGMLYFSHWGWVG
jgi:hypothetical protein